MIVKEMKEKIELFLKLKTYTFIKTSSDKFYNGSIIKLAKEYILFKDDVLNEIPILLSEIQEIDFSRRGLQK